MVVTRLAYAFLFLVILAPLAARAAPPSVAQVVDKLAKAQGKSLQVRWNRSHSRPRLVFGAQLKLSGRTLRAKVDRFTSLYPGILVSQGSELAFIDRRKSQNRSVLRYQQRYRNIPVFRRQTSVAFDRKGRLVSIHSSSTRVQLDDTEAKQSAKQATNAGFAALHGREITPLVAARASARLVILAEGKSRLVYAVRLPIGGDLRGRVHLVDAKTGRYLGWRPGVHWERPAGLFAAGVKR